MTGERTPQEWNFTLNEERYAEANALAKDRFGMDIGGMADALPREAYFTLSAVAHARRLQEMPGDLIDGIVGRANAHAELSSIQLAEAVQKAYGMPNPDIDVIDVKVHHSLADANEGRKPVLAFRVGPAKD